MKRIISPLNSGIIFLIMLFFARPIILMGGDEQREVCLADLPKNTSSIYGNQENPLAQESNSIHLSPACIYTDKIDLIPDLTQTDPEAKLPGGGKVYCGPVSASNAFIWLAGQGFSKLAPNIVNPKEAQAEIARLLGTKKYMHTSFNCGTETTNFLKGVSRYIQDCQYQYSLLEYQGWERHPDKFSGGVEIPDPEWIKNGLIGVSAVWLKVGWYKYNPATNKYRRFDGHWVTLVGYGVDREGNENPNVIIIHDSAPRSGKKSSREFVRLEKINSGTLVGKKFGLPRCAVDYYKLTDGLHRKEKADFGILDGAVVLQMK